MTYKTSGSGSTAVSGGAAGKKLGGHDFGRPEDRSTDFDGLETNFKWNQSWMNLSASLLFYTNLLSQFICFVQLVLFILAVLNISGSSSCSHS